MYSNIAKRLLSSKDIKETPEVDLLTQKKI